MRSLLCLLCLACAACGRSGSEAAYPPDNIQTENKALDQPGGPPDLSILHKRHGGQRDAGASP